MRTPYRTIKGNHSTWGVPQEEYDRVVEEYNNYKSWTEKLLSWVILKVINWNWWWTGYTPLWWWTSKLYVIWDNMFSIWSVWVKSRSSRWNLDVDWKIQIAYKNWTSARQDCQSAEWHIYEDSSGNNWYVSFSARYVSDSIINITLLITTNGGKSLTKYFDWTIWTSTFNEVSWERWTSLAPYSLLDVSVYLWWRDRDITTTFQLI